MSRGGGDSPLPEEMWLMAAVQLGSLSRLSSTPVTVRIWGVFQLTGVMVWLVELGLKLVNPLQGWEGWGLSGPAEV